MRVDGMRNREAVLAAAGELFDRAADPDEVSMDAVAAAAGVGKGTVFRGFGDRIGLLRALVAQRMTADLSTVELGTHPTADDVADLLVRMWQFKSRHRVLTLALERAGRGSPYENPLYDHWHAQLRGALAARRPGTADFLAHVLLGAVRSDLVEHLRDDHAPDPVTGLRDLARAVLPPG